MLISFFTSRIGVYHQTLSDKCLIPNWWYNSLILDEKFQPFKLRSFQINFSEMFLNYSILTLPLYFTFMYLLNPSNYLEIQSLSSNTNYVFIASLLAIPLYLISIRILTNPLNTDTLYLNEIKKFYLKEPSIKQLKERIISFYFGLTTTTYFLMLTILIYKSFSIPTSNVLFFYQNLIEMLKKSFVPDYSLGVILFFICVYFLVIFMLSGVVEFILEHFKILEETN